MTTRSTPSSFGADATRRAAAADAARNAAATAAPLARFSPHSARLLAAATSAPGTMRLRVWDSRLGSLVSEFAARAACNALAWTPAQAGTDTACVALALDSGDVVVFSTARKTLVAKLTGHPSAATAVAVHEPSATVFSAHADGSLIQWDVAAALQVARFLHDGATHGSPLRVAVAGSRLVSASRNIRVWDVATHEPVASLPGHAADVTALALQGTTLASIAEGDRSVMLWDIGSNTNGVSSKQPAKQLATLSLTAFPVHVALAPSSDTLAALTEDGTVHMFDKVTQDNKSSGSAATPKKRKNKPVVKSPDATVRIVNTLTSDKSAIPILSVAFVETANSCYDLAIAYGSSLRPITEVVPLLNGDGMLEDIVLERAFDENSVLLSRDEVQKASTNAALGVRQKDLKANAAISSHASTAAVASLTEDGADQEASEMDAEMTMEEKLKQSEQAKANSLSGGAEEFKKKRNDFHSVQADSVNATTGSLHQLLVQAIHSGDAQLLDQALQVQDIDKIFRSVRKLSPGHAVQLVDELLDRLEKRPTRVREVVEWVRAVLITHAGYLASIPHLGARLGALRQVLLDRQRVLPLLTSLGGRLDLLMSQIVQREIQRRGASDSDEEDAADVPEFHDSDASDDESEYEDYYEDEFMSEDDDDEDDDDDDEEDDEEEDDEEDDE